MLGCYLFGPSSIRRPAHFLIMAARRRSRVDGVVEPRSKSRSRSNSKAPLIRKTRNISREEFVARSSLLDPRTTPYDLAEGEPSEDAWKAVCSGSSVPFSRQPFSRQIQGWIHLFWVIIVFYSAVSWYDVYKKTGSWSGPTSWRLLHMTYGDWWGLFGSDVFLIAWTFVAVPLQALIAKDIIPSRGVGSWLIRHIISLSPILIGVKICTMKSWPNFQIATFLAHATVLFMKMHSYLAHNAELHEKSLSKKRTDKVSNYPSNVTLSDFAHFLLCPTLIYKTSYPKTPKIRWSFVFDRTIGILVIVSMIYINIDMYMFPVIRQIRTVPFFDAFTKLLLPISLTTILLFFLVFEYILHWFAEITRFADRHFYSDWWNSVDYAEFARKWNNPVHKFLQHHVYLACITKHGWSKTAAAFWTFLFSSILHELVMSMAAKHLRWEFFVSQMLQIPLIWVSSKLQLSKYPIAGNIFFWASIFSGMTVLFIIYAKSAM